MNKMYSNYRLLRKCGLELFALKRDFNEITYLISLGTATKSLIRSKYMRWMEKVARLETKIKTALDGVNKGEVFSYKLELNAFLQELVCMRNKLEDGEVVCALF